MTRHLLLLSLLLTACTAHQTRPTKILPLTQIRLYETGVGYFVRAGQLTARDSVQLPVPAGHLDDALKTLTVLGGQGKLLLQGLSFPSSMSHGMAQALAGLAPGSSGQVQFRELLAGLKGHQLELQTAQGPLRGQLLEVVTGQGQPAGEHGPASEQRDADAAGKGAADAGKSALVLIMTAEGSIRQVPLAQITQVRPMDAELEARLRSAFQALSRAGGGQRALQLLAEAEGPVTLGYVAEAPLWRCSYRLVLSAGALPTLQGWALIHNDSDEAWRSVQVELVSGRPDSFLFPLAVPRYQHRQLLHPEQALPSVPQLLTTTTDQIWGDQLDSEFGSGGLGLSGAGYGGGGTGEGTIGLGSLGTIGGGGGPAASAELTVGNLASFARAAGAESGALFRYRLARGLDVAAHGSALIPFLQAPISAERVTLLRELAGPARSALIFSNSSGQTLPAGTISLFAQGGFAGESFLARVKPGERRFLEFGTDLDVTVESSGKPEEREEVKRVTYQDGQLLEHYLRHQILSLVLKNRSQQARRVLIQLQLNKNAKVEGADALDFDTEVSRPIVSFALGAGARLERQLKTVEGLVSSTLAKNLELDQLQKLAQLATLPQPQRAVFSACAGLKIKQEALKQQLQGDQAAAKRTTAELERLRQHLAAAGDKGGAGAPLVRRILQSEDRYRALEKTQVEQQEALKQLQAQLVAELERLN